MRLGIKQAGYRGLLFASLISSMHAAHAVSVDEQGLGEVLLFPFYSVVNGNDTTINIVNTRNEVKAVKVRFREGMNGKEVLNFNLYLAPFDHWAGVITRDPNGDGALFKTQDTSCTVPAFSAAGQPFNPVLFAADSNNGAQRTREGYIEMIEMGEVVDGGANTFASDATHIAGVPADCGSLRNAWGGGGAWLTDPTVDMLPNTGGLYGYSFLLNVNAGTAAAYNATALSGFAPAAAILHARPGNIEPSLNAADPIAKLIDNDTFYSINTATGLDAVSAVLMKETITNDFVLEPTINAGTDFVLTFPTKHDYVNGQVDDAGEPIALAPFTSPWDAAASEACEEIDLIYYNRETHAETPVSYLPLRPPVFPALCTETTIFTFNNADVLGAQASGGNLSMNLNLLAGMVNGWMTLGFVPQINGSPADYRKLTATGHTLSGLPVIGFAIQKYVNSTLIVNGQTVLSNYAGIVDHTATRSITTP